MTAPLDLRAVEAELDVCGVLEARMHARSLLALCRTLRAALERAEAALRATNGNACDDEVTNTLAQAAAVHAQATDQEGTL